MPRLWRQMLFASNHSKSLLKVKQVGADRSEKFPKAAFTSSEIKQLGHASGRSKVRSVPDAG